MGAEILRFRDGTHFASAYFNVKEDVRARVPVLQQCERGLTAVNTR